MKQSISRQLFLYLSGMLFILWITVVVLVASVVKYETNEIFDSGLQEIAQRILPLADAQLALTHNNLFLNPVAHDEYISYQVLNSNRDVLLKSHKAPEVAYSVPLKTGMFETNNQNYYIESNEHQTLFVVVAENQGHRFSTIKDTLVFLVFPLVIMIPFTWVLVWGSVNQSKKSITSLGSELSKRTSSDLKPIDTEALPQELLDLGVSINALMYRLNLALESERNFAANSAHELRTPIAAALAQVDVLKVDLKGDDLHRALEAKRMLKKLENMTVKLLQLARAESGFALYLKPMELKSIVSMVLRDFQLKETHEIKFSTESNEVWIQGDVDAAGIVIQNLTENALKYAAENTTIEIILNQAGVLKVINDCEPLPKDLVDRISHRFVRADERHPGSGIGLAVVETIVNQLGGTLEIDSPCMLNNRGFCVTVCFKAADVS